jgi:glutamate/tyrosine decarboxylase-like PLP-dependent enzyme
MFAEERAEQIASRFQLTAPAANVVDCLEQANGDRLREPFPDGPTPPGEVIERLDCIGSPATVATTGGRFFGLVVGGALPAAVAASWMVAAWDQNVVLRSASPAAVAFEDVAIEWVRSVLGLPPQCGGALVTGATRRGCNKR